MQSLDILLDRAEEAWRATLSKYYPEFKDLPVDHSGKDPNFPMDFFFATDVPSKMIDRVIEKKVVHAIIHNEKGLRSKFTNIIKKFWQGSVDELILEKFKFGYNHESMHHIDVPGHDEQDEIEIIAAMRRGITAAIPGISAVELTEKIGSSWNLIYDFIINTRLEYENRELGRKYYREDAIAIGYFLGQHASKKSKTNIMSILALTYGLLYGPKITHHYFQKKAGGSTGYDVAIKALSALLNEKVYLESYKPDLVEWLRLKLNIYSPEPYSSNPLQEEYNRRIWAAFSGDDRYGSVERFMKVLAPYITNEAAKDGDISRKGNGSGGSGKGSGGQGQGKSKNSSGKEEKPSNGNGEKSNEDGGQNSSPDEEQKDAKSSQRSSKFNSGMSPNDLVDKIMQGMNDDEKEEFLKGLMDANKDELKQLADSLADNGTEEYKFLQNLDLMVIHEYYKSNRLNVALLGPRQFSQLESIGNKLVWEKTSTKRLNLRQFKELKPGVVKYLNTMSKITKLPWIRQLEDGVIITMYSQKQVQIMGRVPYDKVIKLPDLFDFYLDFSLSMFNNESRIGYVPGDGSKWDNLCKVTYGLIYAMKEASDYLGKPTKLRITNFSGDNKVSKEIYINDFWKGDLDVLRTLFYFDRENEGTVLDIDTKDRQTDIAYFIGTDGELNHSSHVTREAAKIKKLASKKSNNVFYFEIDGTFGLGKEVKKIKDAYYKRVSSKGYLDLLKEGINVFMHRN